MVNYEENYFLDKYMDIKAQQSNLQLMKRLQRKWNLLTLQRNIAKCTTKIAQMREQFAKELIHEHDCSVRMDFRDMNCKHPIIYVMTMDDPSVGIMGAQITPSFGGKTQQKRLVNWIFKNLEEFIKEASGRDEPDDLDEALIEKWRIMK